MPNGKPGDDPLTDMLHHGLHPFPMDIEASLREVFAINPNFPDDGRRWLDQVEWMDRIRAWSRGQDLDAGRKQLKELLSELRK